MPWTWCLSLCNNQSLNSHHPHPEHDVPFHVWSKFDLQLNPQPPLWRMCAHSFSLSWCWIAILCRCPLDDLPNTIKSLWDGWQLTFHSAAIVVGQFPFITNFRYKYLLLQSGLLVSTASGLYSFFKDDGNFHMHNFRHSFHCDSAHHLHYFPDIRPRCRVKPQCQGWVMTTEEKGRESEWGNYILSKWSHDHM